MGSHLIGGEFQSDKYPTCPAGKVPLSTKDPTAQDLLWEYAQRRRAVDAEFADDLETALRGKGYDAQRRFTAIETLVRFINAQGRHISEPWKEDLAKAFGLEIDEGNPYRPVRRRGAKETF